MQAYDQAVVSASKIISQAITSDLNCVIDNGLELDDLITDISRRINHQVTQQTMEAASLRLSSLYAQQGWHPLRNKVVKFKTVHGEISINSPYLRRPGQTSGLRPMKLHFGVTGGGMSHCLERILCSFGAEKSFQKAADALHEHYGHTIDKTTLQRHTEMVGQEAEAWLQTQYQKPLSQAPQAADEVICELDGCDIRTGAYAPDRKTRKINWMECRTGVIRRTGSTEPLFVCANEPYTEPCHQLVACLDICGREPDTQVIAPGDGGIGLMETMVESFPKIQYILDHRHLKSHFYGTADSLGYADKARELWVKRHMSCLWANDIDRVQESLSHQYEQTGNDELRKLIAYVERFRECVSYGYFRDQGWPVGSGEVESSHRYVPQCRVKIPGATWHPNNLNPMLALRVIRTCRWWDKFWKWRQAQNYVPAPEEITD